MPKKAKRVLVLIIGIIFIIFGLAGFVLPLLQGVFFTVIGLILLSVGFPKIRLWVKKHTKKYPHLSGVIEKIEKWTTKIIGGI